MQPTYAPVISNCWNQSTSQTTTNSHLSKNKLMASTSTCLICPNIVFLRENIGTEESTKMYKVLKNMCHHMRLDSSEFPKDFSETTFPFCPTCNSLLMELWTHHLALEQVQRKIAKTVSAIEHIAADAEILGDKVRRNSSTSSVTIGQQRFTKLRDLILDGYRKKLLRKQQLQQSAMHDNKFKHPAQTQPAQKRNNKDSSSANKESSNKRHTSSTECIASTSTTIKRKDVRTNDLNTENSNIESESRNQSETNLPSVPVTKTIPPVDALDSYEEQERMETESVNLSTTDDDSMWTVDPIVVATCTRLVSAANVGDSVSSRKELELEPNGRIDSNNGSLDSNPANETSVIPMASGASNLLALLTNPIDGYHIPLKKNMPKSGNGPAVKKAGNSLPIQKRNVISRSRSTGQRVVAADGTVVTVTQDVVDMLRKS